MKPWEALHNELPMIEGSTHLAPNWTWYREVEGAFQYWEPRGHRWRPSSGPGKNTIVSIPLEWLMDLFLAAEEY